MTDCKQILGLLIALKNEHIILTCSEYKKYKIRIGVIGMYNTQLDTFIKVADAGSFNKAAERLYVTPTAVIKQINLLEGNLDLKLFERTHRGLKLTKAGKSLYYDAKYIIQYSQDSIIRAKNAMQNNTDIIRIGSSPITPVNLLMQLWSEIQIHCPNLKFEMVPFENTPENAREILANLGQNIDIVGGIFDETTLDLRHCAGLELSMEPLCCAVSIHHPLAEKDILNIEDLYGENLLLISRGWSRRIDLLRDDIENNHRQIHIIDFDFYNVTIFNRCENGNDLLLAISGWDTVHPLLKVIPVTWPYSIPYGLLYASHPSEIVKQFLAAAKIVLQENKNEQL